MSSLPVILIGTRKSPLALAQAEEVSRRLCAAHPGLVTDIVTFTTSGDKFLDKPLADIGGKGLFTKEIEDALLIGDIHIAVHSMKDMPTVLPEGLTIGAMLEREDPRDVLMGQGFTSLADLPRGATLGTSSLRRAAQMKMKRPDVQIVPLRGNVQTRINKLLTGEIQATMLAKAGLNRLGMHDVAGVVLPVEQFLPAIAQGAVGIECRENDAQIRDLLASVAHNTTEITVNCERAFLRALDGSCRTPIAGYATLDRGQVKLRGLIAKPDGTKHHVIEYTDSAADADEMGYRAGKELLGIAGKDFLSGCN